MATRAHVRDPIREPAEEAVKQALRAAGGGGGGGGFTPVSDDFSGDLSAWTKVGTSSIVSGVWRVAATIASIWLNDYAMPVVEGSWDMDVVLSRSGTFEHQVAIWASDDMRSVALPVQGGVGVGYALRVLSTGVYLWELDSGGTQIKQFGTGTITTGDKVTLRVTIAANGDRTFTCFVNDVQKGTSHTVVAANLPAGLGTNIGIAGSATSGQTTDADNFSFDETA